MNDALILLRSAIPTFTERVLMGIGALIGGWAGYLLGGIDIALLWLCGFVVIDYFTGNFAVLKQGKWQSKLAYKGIFKKLFIFIMVTICNGIDESLHLTFVRDACVIAYILNETGSILENVERMGYGEVIPPILRQSLKILREREEARLNNIKENNNNE